MTINHFFKLCTDEEKGQFRRYFEEKLPHLQTVLAEAEAYQLDVTVERFVKKSAYKVTLLTRTKVGEFMASEDDHTIAEALDFAKDKLVAQVRKKEERQKDRNVKKESVRKSA